MPFFNSSLGFYEHQQNFTTHENRALLNTLRQYQKIVAFFSQRIGDEKARKFQNLIMFRLIGWSRCYIVIALKQLTFMKYDPTLSNKSDHCALHFLAAGICRSKSNQIVQSIKDLFFGHPRFLAKY